MYDLYMREYWNWLQSIDWCKKLWKAGDFSQLSSFHQLPTNIPSPFLWPSEGFKFAATIMTILFTCLP